MPTRTGIPDKWQMVWMPVSVTALSGQVQTWEVGSVIKLPQKATIRENCLC